MAAPPSTQGQQSTGGRNAAIAGGVLAGLVATRGSGAVVAVPPAAAAGGLKLSAAAIGELTEKMVEMLASFQRERVAGATESVRSTLSRAFPGYTTEVIDDLAREEANREVEFGRKMAARLRRDIPVALAVADRDARRAAVQAILDRERRYVEMREEAMADRAVARAEMLAVKEASPQGAYWQLSDLVRNHTPDCVALAGKFWPWSVIEAVGPPPRHHGCRCSLLTLNEAVARDLMDAEQAKVEPRDALARARQALRDAATLEETLTPDEWQSWVDELYEGAETKGAMIALYPHPIAARRIAVEGGEPADSLHVTLKFLGADHADLGGKLKEKLKASLAEFAAGEKPLEGRTAGAGFFPPNPKHKADETPILANVEVPGIHEFRARLVKALPAGMLEDTFPDFKPHLTVKYVPAVEKGEKPELPVVPPTKLSFGHVVLALGNERHRFELGTGNVEEAIDARRYPKGFEHGGEFMPKIGGNAGREILRGVKRSLAKRLAPEMPPSGLELARQGRGRQVGLGGRSVFVPEARAFDRTIGGRRFTSPPFSTRVYRDGAPFNAPEAPSGRAGEIETPALGPVPAAVTDAQHSASSAASERVLGALAAHKADHEPVAVGEAGKVAMDALEAHGFIETAGGATGTGSRRTFVAPDRSSTLTVNLGHGGAVESVRWEPKEPETPGRLLTRPPSTWEEFAGDARSLAQDIARRQGKTAHVGQVLASPPDSDVLSDHAGEWRRQTGDIVAGADVKPSLLTAAVTRARGGELTDGQRRSVWASYQSIAHEALHAAAPASRQEVTNPHTVALNEALVEELSHVEAARWLARQGQGDVASWRADNPTDPVALGTYTSHRLWLDRMMTRARVPVDRREEFMSSLLHDVRAGGRLREVARVSAEANGTRQDREESKLLGLMPHAGDDTHFVPILAPDITPTRGASEPYKLGGGVVRVGDRVGYTKRTMQAGATDFDTHNLRGAVESLTRSEKGGGWTATVRRDDGRVDYAVLPSQMSHHEAQDALGTFQRPARSFGGAADEIRVGGHTVAEGTTIEFARGDGTTATATVSRIVRSRNPHDTTAPGWVLEATTESPDRRSSRILLTPDRVESSLKVRGGPKSGPPGEGGRGAPHDLMLTVNDRVSLGRYFRLPPGTVAAPASRLVPARLDTPTAVRDARVALMDPRGGGRLGPLEVHPTGDGRFVVTGGVATLQAGLARGLDRFPVVVSPVAAMDRKLPSLKGAAAEGLRRAREIVAGGGSGRDIARAGLGREDASDPRSGFQRGLRAGFHEVAGAADANPGFGSLFGWAHGGKKPEPGSWEAKQEALWAGRAPAKAKKPEVPVMDDAGIVTIKGSAGGSNGARVAVDAEGNKWLVKDYKGDQDRVATELLANAVYGKLGVPVPKAGTLSFGGKAALAYPMVEGVPGGHGLRVTKPNAELAKGFMADAFLANWDVVGLDHDNLLWPEGTTKENLGPDTPATRLDQGGSLRYRAMGGRKEYGPVPTEVWTMASPRGGQAYGTMALSSEIKRNGAREIAEGLDDATIDGLVEAAGFKDKGMADEVGAAMKARRDWMAEYAAGRVQEPRPAEGVEAAKLLTGGQKGLELHPEQEMALGAWGDGWGEIVNDHLRSGAKKEAASKEVRFVTSELDSLLAHVRTAGDAMVYSSLSASVKPDGGWGDLEGKGLREPGFHGGSLDKGRADREGAATVRLLLPSGSHALYLHGVPDLDTKGFPAQPDVLVERGARMKVLRVSEVGGRTVLDAVLS